ncbi:hypothetical protein UA08_07571 [Talaromyces atroroseus]|uniref:Uncharacterized protein n=1 Tax=Talaromyces atroroseus TaxID=1441469 RepID=A0A225A8T8_TALAT|nr:hypothetical protein UA08_07571 [Talaromyces atroroseus]OKL57092.1 hypothetical protein UA08_07571 [Talaromyces atroroseus]
MVGKKSEKALRDEGLERTDNNMELSSWPQIAPINQKNYYTYVTLLVFIQCLVDERRMMADDDNGSDYLKRDDQLLAFRLQNEEARNRMAKTAKDRDRALALGKQEQGDAEVDGDTAMEDAEEAPTETAGSKVIVLHLGSQNLRIGLASDALPKTVPMVIARKSAKNESEDGVEPRPKRIKLNEDGEEVQPEKQFGPEFASLFGTMCAELKTHMRQNKRRMLPNSKEMVINYNRRTVPEHIPEHNDPSRVEWTEISSPAPEYITGQEALRIPDDSKPRYKLSWPIQHGWCNEKDYDSARLLFLDISLILEDAIKTQLGLTSKKDWTQYSCVFVIPDLYERTYVSSVLEMLMKEFSFARVCFIQESLAATFGAGYTSACIVDIGAQKTSICCVEEGMCIENSRINLKYGGFDITETFIKMMLYDHFPYADINLRRRYDFLLAEELKKTICTMNESGVSTQVFDFHLRISGQDTRKYMFKAYDEIHLAPMGYFQPAIFSAGGDGDKLQGRRKLLPRSLDIYDGQQNDPTSAAQSEILAAIAPPLPAELAGVTTTEDEKPSQTNGTSDVQATPSRSHLSILGRVQDVEATPRSSVAGSPAPETTNTPSQQQQQQHQNGTPIPGDKTGGTAAAVSSSAGQQPLQQPPPQPRRAPTIEERDDILPVYPLDQAILTSITHAARSDDKKMRDFLGGIMVLGGGSQVQGFHAYLEERLHVLRPAFAKEIMIGTPPRDLDAQVVLDWSAGV